MAIQILIGDCREKLQELPDASVHCCVTSPPYFGLRDYGTAQWAGGNPECDHLGKPHSTQAGFNERYFGKPSETDKQGALREPFKSVCGKCGATRIDRQMGLEPTPDEFVAGMVDVFREVRRVLRDDGTLWLNIGDSYASDAKGSGGTKVSASILQGKSHAGAERSIARQGMTVRKIKHGLKQKDLIGIPWLLAFALRADGWYLRQDIIWSKPNPMPESVRDRCTKAHEYLFLLSKGPRYYYDAEAIAEPVTLSAVARLSQNVEAQLGSERVPGKTNGRMKAVGRATKGYTAEAYDTPQSEPRGSKSDFGDFETRNKRSVWEVATQPFSEAHFATYPPALIDPCILAGCPKGGTVLDPFFGAGTTGLVADRLGRNCIGVELNPEYASIAQRRLKADSPLFAKVEAA
jgi:DNA modification methylase